VPWDTVFTSTPSTAGITTGAGAGGFAPTGQVAGWTPGTFSGWAPTTTPAVTTPGAQASAPWWKQGLSLFGGQPTATPGSSGLTQQQLELIRLFQENQQEKGQPTNPNWSEYW